MTNKQNTDHQKVSGGALLQSTILQSAQMLKTEKNRYTFLTIGLFLIFFFLVMFLLPEKLRWISPALGALAATIIFLDRHVGSRQPICENQGRPCSEISACWPSRTAAESALVDSLLAARKTVFIAGACLTTLRDVFARSEVVEHLARKIEENPSFTITLVTTSETDAGCSVEDGRSTLTSNLKMGHNIIRRFIRDLSYHLADKDRKMPVNVRAYDERATPRHFIMDIDDTVYFGSYLCHEQGFYSYLLRLAKPITEKGLITLFAKEITYIREHSKEYDIFANKKYSQGGTNNGVR